MNPILIAVLVLGAIALVAAAMLFLCSKKFAVQEDPRIEKVSALLPQANCGGCGYPGCGGLASALVKSVTENNSIDGLSCPVGGQDVMNAVAECLGISVKTVDPLVAVVRCQGTCENRPTVVSYSGLRTCATMNACGAGESACGYGCLGCGDCQKACKFGAIKIDLSTGGIAKVDQDLCTSCGACVKACPRKIICLRKKGVKGRRVYVACMNKDKGPVASKACHVACIGCGKCQKECAFEAITISENLSYIDPLKCKLCRKCEKSCPTHAIVAVNFPAPKPPKVEQKPSLTQADMAKKDVILTQTNTQ